jgi:hypothetical protein
VAPVVAAMTWEQKLAALTALGDTSLRMRKPGDWYVDHRGVEIGDGHILDSGHGDGATPEAAVEDRWACLTLLPPNKIIVLDAMRATRREVRWNGFMWADSPSLVQR